jgi:alkylhydroperoxidase family enzyme
MARIEFPDHGMGEHVDWSLLRANMAVGMGALSDAVYGNSQLPVREREAARWTIALINDCAVCRATRTRSASRRASTRASTPR